MSYKLKHDSIALFCQELTSEICDVFFAKQDAANGNQLSSLTGSKQTNLLLIKVLFDKWQEETAKLESPYFDFEADEVQEALNDFMNTLSKHMKVARPDLEPLFESALHQSVLIHFDPQEFYAKELLTGMDKIVSMDDLKGLMRYLKVNAQEFESLIGDEGKDATTKSKLVSGLKKAYADFDTDDLDPADFLNDLNCQDRLDQLFEELEAEQEPEVELEAEEPAIEEEEEVVETPEPVTVNDENGKSSAAIHEKYSKPSKTLAEELQKKVTKDIESSLGVNERIMFIKALFDGNKDSFKSALQDLESSTDLQDARSKVDNNYGLNWDMETEEAEAFIHVLERRFA